MDDDSLIDFGKLKVALEANIGGESETTISCPSVTKNRKVWRHAEAKMMGKWAHTEDEIPDKYLPDYCNGFLYTFSPKVGLALAQVAKGLGASIYPTRNDEDYLVTGLLAKRLSWVTHRSLAPVLGSLWDKFLSHCPLLDVLRYAFNPIALGAGSSDSPELQYVGSPQFLACVFFEYIRYQYFLGVGLEWDPMQDICDR